ncbi:MAG: hypothetical protein LBQ52_09765, partial [Helicobacteraceae bacterium]|nr:hypothetical protein [Helicobacteraceae bacterium]
GWNPIGDDSNPFAGIFNGNGYAVRNLWIDRSTNFVGLFGYALNAKIRNLGVEINNSNGGVKGAEYVGAIAGYVDNSFITDSYSTGEVSGIYYVGAIAGDISYSSITNSYSKGNIGGYAYVGGIAGAVYYDSSITNSYSTGNVSGDTYVGGIAGDIYLSTIENNAAINKEVNGSSDVNRIVGYISGGSVQNNFALDTMTTNLGSFSNAGVSSYHGTSKTNDNDGLKSQSTYDGVINGDGNGGLGWKFGNDDENPWKIDAIKHDGYPYLYWQK